MDPPSFAQPPPPPPNAYPSATGAVTLPVLGGDQLAAAGYPVGAYVAQAPQAPERKKHVDSAKKPKRPKTAYHFFYEARRKQELERAKEEERPPDNNLISKNLGIEWKAMTPDDRKAWNAMADAARTEYNRQVQEFKDLGGRMDDVVPSKPLSAYMLYFQAKHRQQGGDKVIDFAKIAGAEWKGLPDANKQPFYEAARKQRELYDAQVAFCAKSKDGLVNEKFLDSRPSAQRFGAVKSYDAAADGPGIEDDGPAYAVEYDDSPGNLELLSLGELRARVCGDERAAKRAASKLEASAKKRKALDEGAPLVVAEAAPPRHPPPPKQKKAKKPKPAPPPPPEDEGPPLGEDEILHVVRLSRRLVGGASVANLKRMCAAARLSVAGTKGALSTRLEYHLREKNFESNDFEPSKADVEDLSIDDFNAKYENTEAYTIGDIEDIIADL